MNIAQEALALFDGAQDGTVFGQIIASLDPMLAVTEATIDGQRHAFITFRDGSKLLLSQKAGGLPTEAPEMFAIEPKRRLS